MYNRRYMKCCSSNNYCPNVLETACDNVENCDSYELPDSDDSCMCGFEEDKSDSVFPENPVLAQSYVPIQKLDKTFIPSVGLKMGTIFPELVSPYAPCQSLEEIAFIKAMNKIGEGCNKC